MQFLTDFADQSVILPVVAVALLTFMLLRWWRGAAAWAGVIGTTFALVLALKLGLKACGGDVAAQAWMPRNPSGHVASATAAYGGLAAIAFGQHRAFLLPAVLFAGVIGGTRVGLGVHTVPDVVTGGLIGIAAVASLHPLAGQRPRAHGHRLPLLLALAVASLLHGTHFDAEGIIRRFAARLRPALACGVQMPDRSAPPAVGAPTSRAPVLPAPTSHAGAAANPESSARSSPRSGPARISGAG